MEKEGFYDMRVIITPLFVCLFCRLICWLVFLVCKHTANSHVHASIHACTHAICVKRFGGGKKGLMHYFRALVGACKRIRRGKLSDGGKKMLFGG